MANALTLNAREVRVILPTEVKFDQWTEFETGKPILDDAGKMIFRAREQQLIFDGAAVGGSELRGRVAQEFNAGDIIAPDGDATVTVRARAQRTRDGAMATISAVATADNWVKVGSVTDALALGGSAKSKPASEKAAI